MSADRISVCPKCRAKAIAKSEALEKRAYEGYGKIPVREFEDLLLEVKRANQDAVATNLFENYEVYMQVSGDMYFTYGCRCDFCKWKWSITKTFNSNEE